jgi:hypothetical protein
VTGLDSFAVGRGPHQGHLGGVELEETELYFGGIVCHDDLLAPASLLDGV